MRRLPKRDQIVGSKRPHPGRGLAPAGLLLMACAALVGCATSEEPIRISLIDRFDSVTIANAVAPGAIDEPVEWRFGTGSGGWTSFHDTTDLRVEEGRLVGRTGDYAMLVAPVPESLEEGDLLHGVEIRMRASAGTLLGVDWESGEELDPEDWVPDEGSVAYWTLSTDLIPGDDFQTYTLTSANSSFEPSFPLSRVRHLVIGPSNEAEADFEIESVRLISRRQHLRSIESGIGWHGMGDVFREALVARSPERLVFDIDMPRDASLELAIGTVEDAPLTFRVEFSGELLVERTVSTPRRWESVPIDLSPFAGRSGPLTLSLAADEDGAIGFWGTPVIRRAASPPTPEPTSAARTAAIGKDTSPPQGVVLILADTLRRDFLQPYGHDRDNAPVLSAMAQEGVLFEDTIAQGTWTKVSAPSILTSLYPSTHGLSDMPDRLAATVTTLAEAYRNAGFATFATSSVPFTGKLSNLHQGVEVLHERSSISDLPASNAKTARTWVDRLLPWLDAHRAVPFFVFLHVFDPHTPFEPYRPYESMWLTPDELAEHRTNIDKVVEVIENDFNREEVLPTEAELEEAGVDRDTFVRHEKTWYDGSIRAMDVEIGRVLERLRELGLAEDTLVAVVSDHGEEFLEHGRHFHGYTAYGEMLNVPMFLWWPAGLRGGQRVAELVETIDLMPTLLEISRLPVPAAAQGRSLLPLLAEGVPGELGWRSRPAFAERRHAPIGMDDDVVELTAFAIVEGGWKLIHNTEHTDDRPEYELFDHANDPLNLENVAADHPEIVERLREQLEAWREATLAARIEPDGSTEDISAEELQRLRSLGYVQ